MLPQGQIDLVDLQRQIAEGAQRGRIQRPGTAPAGVRANERRQIDPPIEQMQDQPVADLGGPFGGFRYSQG